MQLPIAVSAPPSWAENGSCSMKVMFGSPNWSRARIWVVTRLGAPPDPSASITTTWLGIAQAPRRLR